MSNITSGDSFLITVHKSHIIEIYISVTLKNVGVAIYRSQSFIPRNGFTFSYLSSLPLLLFFLFFCSCVLVLFLLVICTIAILFFTCTSNQNISNKIYSWAAAGMLYLIYVFILLSNNVYDKNRRICKCVLNNMYVII